MDYDCQTISADKLLMNSYGVQPPLCNDCLAPDCTNPIRERTVSVLGVSKKMRLWVVNNLVRQVIACKGYMPGDQDAAMGHVSPYTGRDQGSPITVPGDIPKSKPGDPA